ncbi:MAG: MMPL family transporter [Acidimicrobiales bacterium]
MLTRIARWCFTNPYKVIVTWVALLVASQMTAGMLGAEFSDAVEIPNSDSGAGFSILEEHFDGVGAGAEGSIVFAADRSVTDPVVKESMESLLAQVGEIPGVTVESPYASGGENQIAPAGERAGQIAFAAVALDPEFDQTTAGEVGVEILEMVRSNPISDVQVEVGGTALAEFEPPETELIGLGFAVIVLIVALGSVLAMGITVGVAVTGVGVGLALISIISNVMAVPDAATVIGAMIGLGVGIDYALFIVNRYRERLQDGFAPVDAMMISIDTAGRSVIFAGLTVVLSLLGLMLMGLAFVAGLGIAASATVLVTMLASVTLLPAAIGIAKHRTEVTRVRGLAASLFVSLALFLLGIGAASLALVGVGGAVAVLLAGRFVPLLKRQVPARAQKPHNETSWYRWSRLIQAKPWAAALVGLAILGALALPVFDLRLGYSDERNFPADTTTRAAYDLIAEGFGPGFNGPMLIATEINNPTDLSLLQNLAETLRSTEGVAAIAGPMPNDATQPTAALLRIVPSTAPQDAATQELLEHLRSEALPMTEAGQQLDLYITGTLAAGVDISVFLGQRMVWFFGVVLGLSFLLLMAVFRSLVVPLKAVIMNMLSIGGAYGVLVMVFQWGWGASLFGTEGGPIEPYIPMLLFAIVFGLSMDYEVFLLSRIKEEYERTGDAANSVAAGLAKTARVITAAAAIMVVVFGSFTLEDARVLQMLGLGLAMSVLLDATLVRMLLVPATMELLGKRNWWLPGWLDRILPDLRIEGSASEPTEPHAPADETARELVLTSAR